jgi:hypothetical protein
VGFEWDAEKAEANFAKHGVRFTESLSVFDDDLAITVPDDASDRAAVRIDRDGAKGRVLVVVYSWRRTNIRIISARRAETHERAEYEEKR